MSYSLDFCREVASNPLRSFFSDRDWSKAIEIIETEKTFDKFLNRARSLTIKGKTEDENDIILNVNLFFDDKADFDYFISDSFISDGTLLFREEAIINLIQKVCTGSTYNKNVGEPQSGDKIEYTVGNFVILNEHDGSFVSTDKPWLRERTTVLLPLKMEIKN